MFEPAILKDLGIGPLRQEETKGQRHRENKHRLFPQVLLASAERSAEAAAAAASQREAALTFQLTTSQVLPFCSHCTGNFTIPGV